MRSFFNGKRRAVILICVLLLLLSSAVSLYCSKYSLTVTRYTLASPKLTAPVRIVQLTDLHNSVFGEDNIRLTEAVAAQAPDLILITGDLLNQNEERTDIAEELIRSLAPVAPVYVSYGNHETAHMERYGTDLRALYSAAGAVVLEYSWQDVTVNGQTIVLGGIYGYCLPVRVYESEQIYPDEYRFMTDYCQPEGFRLLMCHMPVSWIRYGSLNSWDVDCVLAGHSHGGQARFPLIGGVWAPDQGWFPGRTSGIYRSDDGQRALVLSRGLGNNESLPRFNNIPEIVTLELIPGEGE